MLTTSLHAFDELVMSGVRHFVKILRSIGVILFMLSNDGGGMTTDSTPNAPSIAQSVTPPFDPSNVITRALNNITCAAHEILLTHPGYSVSFKKSGIEVIPSTGPCWQWSNNSASEIEPTLDRNKIVYDRGRIIEQYVIKQNTIEQQFIIKEPLQTDESELIISGSITSGGIFNNSEKGWAWRDELGEVTLGDVIVFDARGNEIAATMSVSGSASTIQVDMTGLNESSYPLLVDPEIGTNDFRISHTGNDGDGTNYVASNAAIAYNGTTQTYLVVWAGNYTGEQEIYGQLINAPDSSFIDSDSDAGNGTDFRISFMGPSGTTYNASSPDVAALGSEFLVVWHGDDNRDYGSGVLADNEMEIYGQRINAGTGELLTSSPIRISTTGVDGDPNRDATIPAVASNETGDRYLTTWSSDHVSDNQFEIFAQGLEADGSLIGGNVRISSMGADPNTLFDAFRPDVAWNSLGNQYLIAWHGDHVSIGDGQDEVFVRRVDGNSANHGNPIGSTAIISDMGPPGSTLYGAKDAAICYNSAENNYLVVWDGDDDTGTLVDGENEIFGQVVSNVGTVTSPNGFFQISRMGTDGQALYGGFNPGIDYDPNLEQFVVVWYGDDNSIGLIDGELEIFGQLITSEAVLSGSRFRISDAGGTGNTGYNASLPAVTYCGPNREHLIVWHGDDNSTTTGNDEIEIWGQRFAELSPEPIAQPTAPLPASITSSSLTFGFSQASGSPNGYLVLRRSGSSPTNAPVDHTAYEVGQKIGTDTVVYIGSALGFNQSGLAANMTYHYDLFSYNGVNASTNYLVLAPLQTNVTTLFAEPAVQASNIGIKSVDQNSFTLNFTKGNGASRLIVAKEQSVAEVFPADASSYTANSDFQTAPETGTGNKIVALRTGSDNTDVLVQNLLPATAYSIRVYEFNGNTTLTNYNTSSTTGNPLVVFTLSAEPASQPSMLEFADIAATSMAGSFDAAAGSPDGYLVVRKPGFAPAGKPVDGKLYVAGDTVGAGGDGTVVYRGNSLSFNSTGLTPETKYEYAIFAYNGNDGSVNYRVTSPLIGNATTLATEPSGQPTTLTFDDITSSSMEVSFSPPAVNPDGYLVIRKETSSPVGKPVDGKTYAAGDTVGLAGDATVAYDGINTSLMSSGLQEETVYHYAIFSYNGDGVSRNYRVASPLTGSKTTYAIEPTAQPTDLTFGGYTTSSMSGSFIPPVPGAEGYVVLSKKGSSPTDIPDDGQALTAGTVFGSSKVVYIGSSTSFINGNLDAGSVYYYDVFAFNGSGPTINYLIPDPSQHSAITISPAPEALDATPVGSTSFTARWNASVGANKYELDVSADNFATFVTNYHAREVTSGLEEGVTGLTPVTSYKYRVRAVNVSGVSASSLEKTVITIQDPVAFGISPPTYAEKFSVGAKISVEVTGARGPLNVTMHSRKISENALLPSAAVLKSGTNTTYEITITNEMADELGLEFYFEADDGVGSVTHPTHYFIYKSIDTSPIPFFAGFNGKTNTYQMFSIPYLLDDKTIAGIFNELGAYDKTRWRLFHYDGNGKKYLEFQGGLPNNIELGKGYWFNSVSDLAEAIGVGTGTVEKANQDDPATITLTQGWNQIGNPYPFNISWDAVLGTEERLGSLQFFENGKYISRDVFKPWTGAFVHADEAMTLSISVLAKTNQSGRILRHELTADLDMEQWLVPITLRVNSLEQTGGVGMHPLARMSKDKFDEITVPRFLDYAEMNTHHDEFFSPDFSTDVVPTAEEQTWIFDVKSNLDDEQGELTWDHTSIAANKSSLILIDLLEGKWVDMKTTGSYRFTHRQGRHFKIIYNREGEIKPGVTLLGEAYPNPFTTELTIPILIDQPGYRQIGIYDALGRRIRTLLIDFSQPGLHEIQWDGKDDNGSEVSNGLLFYQIEDKTKRQVRRIIKI